MKSRFFLYLLSIFIAIPVVADSIDDLVRRDGIYYQKFTDVPFTGHIDEGLFIGKISNGQLNGVWYRYLENGQLKSKGTYEDGLREGTWTEYSHQEDLLYRTESEYSKDKKNGIELIFKKNGSLYGRFNWRDGVRDGPAEWYDDQKNIVQTGFWTDGKIDKEWVFFTNGSISKIEIYDKEEHIKGCYFDGSWHLYYYDKKILGKKVVDEVKNFALDCRIEE